MQKNHCQTKQHNAGQELLEEQPTRPEHSHMRTHATEKTQPQYYQSNGLKNTAHVTASRTTRLRQCHGDQRRKKQMLKEQAATKHHTPTWHAHEMTVHRHTTPEHNILQKTHPIHLDPGQAACITTSMQYCKLDAAGENYGAASSARMRAASGSM
jgi:hypothetical protein